MVKTLPPAGSTSPILAMRYWMRPSRGATSVLSAMFTLEKLDVVLGRMERMLSFCSALAATRCYRPLRAPATLVEDVPRHQPFLNSVVARSICCWARRTAWNAMIGLGLGDRLLPLAHLGFSFLELPADRAYP